jgi:two-component system chemotaxis response regulator CheY
LQQEVEAQVLIQIIQDKAEERFLKMLEEDSGRAIGHGAMHCAFGKTALRVVPDAALLLLKDLLQDRRAEIYFCADGDMVIVWRGDYRSVSEAIIKVLLAKYKSELEMFDHGKLFRFFDSQAQGEDLRLLFRSKMKQAQPEVPKQVNQPSPEPTATAPSERDAWKPEFTVEQMRSLLSVLTSRGNRKLPEILIVEDQDFSRKLLAGLFEKEYRCHSARNAQEAVSMYAEHGPDVTFLDVELPDADGHTLAGLFKKYDANSYIVMVTGNNYAKDVEMAKANKVQGFIVKPYNKQKIMGAFDAFLKRREL